MASASDGSPWIWSCRNQRSNTCWRQTSSGKKGEVGKDQLKRGLKGEWRGLWHGFWHLEKKFAARKVKEKCELDVNVRTVQRTLHRIGLKYAKAEKEITLTKKHKGARLECAKRWLTKHVDFKKVIFTDEKRFKFDGPYGWCTWSRRGEPVVLNKRQMGGGGVMVWGMIFANGNIWLEWLKGRQNSESYKQLLDEKALPRIRREMGNNFILQQDNCSIHVSKPMKEWIAEVNMTTLEWPARSPDLNLIENVWEMLAQLVYDGPEITKEAQLWELIETYRNSRCYCAYVWSLWREIDKSYWEERWYYRILTVFQRCPKNNVACVL